MRRERTVRNVNGTSEIWKESFVDIRSCFKFIPRQGLNMAGTYLLAMIILFLNKFKTTS